MNLIEPHIASLFGLHLPPQVGLFLTLSLIIFLFRRDIREKPNVSGALWLPVLWLLLNSSRSLTQWLNIFGLPVSGPASAEEGSPLDACFYLALAIAGVCILSNRQPEPNFKEALTRLMKRCAYVVVPVSILWIKYYPQLGVGYDEWGGTMNKGIAVGKNMLGADCLTLGFFFFWYLLQTWRTERSTQRRRELWLIAGLLIGISWLLRMAHSATSTIALFVAILIVVFVRIRFIKKYIGTCILAGVVLLAAAELTVGLSGHLSQSLGRGSTLTGRTEIWAHCLEVNSKLGNPIIGAGFESWWIGPRRDLMASFYKDWSPGGAQNDYLDTYLNLGLIGLSILIGLLIATFWKMRLELFRNFEWGRYRLGFFAAIVLHAITERTFGSGQPLWFVFYIIALDYPLTHLTTARPSVGVARSEESREFAYAEEEL